MTTTNKTNDQELPIIPKELKESKLAKEPSVLNEANLSWAGKLFFASVAAYLASDSEQPMKLPIKLRGKPDEMKAVVEAIKASKEYQKALKKPGAKVEDVINILNQKTAGAEEFEKLTGKKWPL